jgi:hypothetical protein
MTDFTVADQWSFCTCGMHPIPKGEKVYRDTYMDYCEECWTVSEKRQARKECGASTSKPHWSEKKKPATRKSA